MPPFTDCEASGNWRVIFTGVGVGFCDIILVFESRPRAAFRQGGVRIGSKDEDDCGELRYAVLFGLEKPVVAERRWMV